MDNTKDWTKKYYSESTGARVEDRTSLWSPELQEPVTKQWTDIYADVDRAMARGEKPDGAAARTIAVRARALLAEFTGGDPGIQKGLNKMWAEPEVTEFVRQAIASLSL